MRAPEIKRCLQRALEILACVRKGNHRQGLDPIPAGITGKVPTGCRNQGKQRLKGLSRRGNEVDSPSAHRESSEIPWPRRISATALGAGIPAAPTGPCTTRIPPPALTPAALLSTPTAKNPKCEMFKKQKLMSRLDLFYRVCPFPIYLCYY